MIKIDLNQDDDPSFGELTGLAIRMAGALAFTWRGPCAGRLGRRLDQGLEYFVIAVGELLLALPGNGRAQLFGAAPTPGERAIRLIGAGSAKQLPAKMQRVN